MVLTAYFVLFPAIGAFATVALRIEGFVRPGGAERASARLDASIEASEPHDFTVRVGAIRLACRSSLTESNPPCDLVARLTQPASTASRPASVTIAIRPSSGTRREQIRR
jgi:hypothetical protein